MNDRTPETATAVVPAGRMQPAPSGTRWYAREVDEWWVALYLVDEHLDTDAQPPVADGLLVMGLCGAEDRYVIAMSGQLVQRYQRTYPQRVATADLVDRVNGGQL